MAKAFSVLSWNIEHLRDNQPKRIKAVAKVLKAEKPDVFGLYEVEGKNVYRELSETMSNYTFHITEGRQTQEILVGIRHGITAMFSQRVAFKGGNPSLRPGALLTMKVDGEDYSLLFLHLKSMTSPLGLGVRDHQFRKLEKLKKKLDKKAGANKRANFIALGDMNTMGMDYRGKKYDIPATAELDKLDKDIKKKSVKMRRLFKSTPNTWSNGSASSYSPSDVDHVILSDHMTLKKWTNKDPINEDSAAFVPGSSEVDVRGWVDETTVGKQDKWIGKYSDHSYLYFEVNKT